MIIHQTHHVFFSFLESKKSIRRHAHKRSNDLNVYTPSSTPNPLS
eukprot:UN04206